MEPRDTIQAQLEVLRQELGRCRWVAMNPEIHGGDAEKLRARVVARFDKELTQLQAEHLRLKAKVASGEPLKDCWDHLGKVKQEADAVFDECLSFFQGVMARTAGLDEGICALTDDLLYDLSNYSGVPWARFTLLSTNELYRDKAEIIRISYPEVSLWSMPLAAHELGHYLGPRLQRNQDGEYNYPFQELLREADETIHKSPNSKHTKVWYHLQEQFADLFATYTLGPAYAAAFILLRMNPTEAHRDSYTHPSGAQRVHGILWTLDKMDKLQATPLLRPFQEVTTRLRDVWCASLCQADQDTLKPADESLVTQRMEELFVLLAAATPEQLALGLSDWLRAGTLANWLRAETLANNLAPNVVSGHFTRRDVLNAAWFTRLASKEPVENSEITRRALATYRRIPPRGQITGARKE